MFVYHHQTECHVKRFELLFLTPCWLRGAVNIGITLSTLSIRKVEENLELSKGRS